MHELTLAIQRLADQAEANARTVITTAAALKDAGEARQSQADQSWSPMGRLLGVLGGLAAMAAVIGLVVALSGK